MTVYDTAWYREQVAKAERGNREHVARYDRSFNGVMAKADRDEDDGGDSIKPPVVDHHISRLADLVAEGSGGKVDRAAALRWLLHHRDGIAMARTHKAAKESTMSTSLGDILKTYGATRICKHICEVGKTGYGEHELVAALTKYAAEQHPELTEAQAFAKLYENASVWRAIAIAKTMPFVADLTPLMVGGEDARDLSDESGAIKQLQKLGADKWPTLSEAQQFANAFSDPVNAALAQRAHRRPTAPPGGAYPFPR
jgi:hypothetical protein